MPRQTRELRHSTVLALFRRALRMRVSMSEMGSLTNMVFSDEESGEQNRERDSEQSGTGAASEPATRNYQEDLRIPGILPSRASLRSMMRLMRNLR